ncbi:MAG TPA: hypothetical protein VF961_10710 [Pyrinomonadaceae bacterium]
MRCPPALQFGTYARAAIVKMVAQNILRFMIDSPLERDNFRWTLKYGWGARCWSQAPAGDGRDRCYASALRGARFLGYRG